MNCIEDLQRKLERLMKEPDNAQLFNSIGVLLYQLQDWQSAAMYFQRAHQLNAEDADILYNYAALLCRQSLWLQAIPLYQAYLALHPHDRKVIRLLADCCYLVGEYEMAAMMCRRLEAVSKEQRCL